MTETKTIHPFEVAGLGLAPFRFVGLSEKTYCACQGAPEVPAGTCDYCFTGIKYCFHIRSADGKNFIVGSDCVHKLSRIDNRLVSEVERAEAKFRREKKEAERKAKWEAVRASREAAIAAKEAEERQQNGGLTDAEVKAKEEAAAAEAVRFQMQEENGWLLKVLDGLHYDSGFVSDMRSILERQPAKNLSGRQLAILQDIYAKSFGRRNSKAYIAAEEEFEAKTAQEG